MLTDVDWKTPSETRVPAKIVHPYGGFRFSEARDANVDWKTLTQNANYLCESKTGTRMTAKILHPSGGFRSSKARDAERMSPELPPKQWQNA